MHILFTDGAVVHEEVVDHPKTPESPVLVRAAAETEQARAV
eukprot:SAG11_NODE_28370_length_322_cov_0.932735_1_plen_40_part_01